MIFALFLLVLVLLVLALCWTGTWTFRNNTGDDSMLYTAESAPSDHCGHGHDDGGAGGGSD